MEIVPATGGDIEALVDLLREGDRHHQPLDRRALLQGTPQDADRTWLAECVADRDQCVLVARERSRTAGMLRARLVRREATRLHAALAVVVIEEIVVAAAHRRRGIGRDLMAEAERWARRQGAGRLQLSFYEANGAAAAFCAALGFAPATRTVVRDL